jgi:hypothetical protein
MGIITINTDIYILNRYNGDNDNVNIGINIIHVF